MTELTHWSLDIDPSHIATLSLNVAQRSVNILSRAVLDECAEMLTIIENQSELKGLILCSAKQGSFVYGADITEFEALASEQDVCELIDHAHSCMNRFEQLGVPTVCCIDGMALGGGLELALSCQYLVATDSPKTAFGFPEITLGLMPGFGGTGRIVRRLSLEMSLEMVLGGKPVSVHQAFQAGLVDQLADTAEEMASCARTIINSPPEQKTQQEDDVAGVITAASDKYLRGKDERSQPAFFAIIAHYQMAEGNPDRLVAQEREVFPGLMLGQPGRHLRRIFNISEKTRKSVRGQSGIRHVHVIGAGTMGGDIAAIAALRGFDVTLTDMNADAINAALRQAEALFERRLHDEAQRQAAGDRLVADPDGSGVSTADIIIEAVAERLDIKKAVFADIEQNAKADAVLATNTSSIMIEDIATCLNQPHRLIGLHFFNPVPVLPLIEVISGAESDENALKMAMLFSGQLGKMPVAVRSVKGFLVNRALLPYIFGAIEMMENGEDPDRIDEAMVRFGMPMGPIELADQIGLDVCADVGAVLGITEQVDAALTAHIDAGHKGRKTNQGFYHWQDRKAVRPRHAYDADEMDRLAETLLMPLIDQCRSAVAEQIVASADDADLGCILGIGFPRYKGGPLGWAEAQER